MEVSEDDIPLRGASSEGQGEEEDEEDEEDEVDEVEDEEEDGEVDVGDGEEEEEDDREEEQVDEVHLHCILITPCLNDLALQSSHLVLRRLLLHQSRSPSPHLRNLELR